MKLGLTIIAIFTTTTLGHFVFNPLPDNTPIIFSNNAQAHISFNNFKLLFYVNLEPYYQLIDTIKMSIQAISEICERRWFSACNITSSAVSSKTNRRG